MPLDFRQHLTTLVYCVHDGRLLLLRRRKEPNLGLWSPPGGRLEVGETPLEGAVRELREETGLAGGQPELAAVVTEVDRVQRETWLMFVVRVAVAGDVPLQAGPEGEPAWVPLDEVPDLPQPQADRHILDAVLAPRAGVAFLNVRVRAGRLEDVVMQWG